MSVEARLRMFSRVGFYVVVIICAVVAWRFQQHWTTPSWPADGIISSSQAEMTSWDAKAIDAASQTNSLLTTLGTAMLGAIGLLLINHSARHRPRHLWSAMGSSVCVGISIYFGYVGYLEVLAATTNHSPINPYNASFLGPSRAQFYALLLAALLFADFTFHELTKKEEKKEPIHDAVSR
jgi:hypothetical protein